MADITISDLELAPALTDDMVLPVENTTDTYAATLAMLRRLINKTFVEVENADFNALTDDGFYQCTGTPTNSPVAGEINWTLQVSAENGVVIQRAFSLDDNFANMYIRRWNGVTWTAWLSNTVTTDTAQTISGEKTFTANTIVNGGAGNGTFTIKNDVTDYGTSAVDLVVATSNGMNQFLVHFQEGNKWCARFEQNTSTKGITFILTECEKVYVPTPVANANDNQPTTTAWFRQSGCSVRTVIDTYKNGNTWHRLWSDGWKEQGGTSSGAPNITFTIPFSDTSYSLLISRTNSSENVVYAAKLANTYFGVGWKIGGQGFNANTTSFSWFACGY